MREGSNHADALSLTSSRRTYAQSVEGSTADGTSSNDIPFTFPACKGYPVSRCTSRAVYDETSSHITAGESPRPALAPWLLSEQRARRPYSVDLIDYTLSYLMARSAPHALFLHDSGANSTQMALMTER